MEFRLLGPLEVQHDGETVAVSAPMQRAVIASLAARRGAEVPIATLLEDLWGDLPPASAVATLRNYVRRLRVALPVPAVVTTSAGYRVDTSQVSIDLERFDRLVGRARAEQSSMLFDEALAIRRGAPLTNIGPVPFRDAEAARIEDVYLGAVEAATALRLRHGRHGEVADELGRLVHDHPFRERLARQYMIALYLGGRAVDALEHVRGVRHRMVSELGMEPGPELRRLEAAILREDTVGIGEVDDALPVAPGRRPDPIPPTRGLPPVATPFVGRDDDVAELARRLTSGRSATVLLHGPGGSGKSALAVAVAHAIAEGFADAAVHHDLRGWTPQAVLQRPGDVAAHLLRALAGPGSDACPLSALDEFRRSMPGRRALLVLDNVRSAEQIAPLLEVADSCVVVVTSRHRLPVPGTSVQVDPLDVEHATELLHMVSGCSRSATDAVAIAEVAERCGRLPLALRLVATRAASRPHWPWSEWSAQLEDTRSRLDRLRCDDTDVRASLAVSLQAVRTGGHPAGDDAVALLEHLGLASTPYVTPAFGAATTGWAPARAEAALDVLVEANMAFSPAPARYVLHDLVALLAVERAARHTEDEIGRVLDRARHWYLAALRRASATATGQPSEHGAHRPRPEDTAGTVEFPDFPTVRRWLDRELPVVVGLLRGPGTTASEAAGWAREVLSASTFHLNLTLAWSVRESLVDLWLDGRPEDPAPGLVHLAIVAAQRGHWAHADDLLARANATVRPDDVHTVLVHLSAHGIVRSMRGDLEAGVRAFVDGVVLADAHGADAFAANSRGNLADVLVRCGRGREALAVLERSIADQRRLGHVMRLADQMNSQLQAYASLEEHAEVVRRAPEVTAAHEVLGPESHQMVQHLLTVARSLGALGRAGAAETLVARARDCAARIEERENAEPESVFRSLVRDLP